MVLDGHSRRLAAQAGGMERQTLRDWVHRYTAACRIDFKTATSLTLKSRAMSRKLNLRMAESNAASALTAAGLPRRFAAAKLHPHARRR